ncbi:MAG: hypothetical protein Q9195_003971 [Heterodermia aff. obscurata]
MKQLSRDPSSRTRFLKAEARANEKSGGGVSSITIKPIGSSTGGGGFKKGGFKAAFGSAVEEGGGGETKSETKGKGDEERVDLKGGENSDEGEAEEQDEMDWDGESMYDPKQPTGCWAGCPGLHA